MQKILMILLCGILSRHLYAMPCYVAEVDHAENMVCFCDYVTGHDWWQDGCEDWQEGDGANLVMWDYMTENYRLDDVIIRATYDRPDLYVEMMKGAENND